MFKPSQLKRVLLHAAAMVRTESIRKKRKVENVQRLMSDRTLSVESMVRLARAMKDTDVSLDDLLHRGNVLRAIAAGFANVRTELPLTTTDNKETY